LLHCSAATDVVVAAFNFLLTKSGWKNQFSMAHTIALTGVKTNHGLPVIALAALMTGIIGCGGGTDQPELGLVSGTVTLDGSPLSDTAVTFVPDDGRPAMGQTDSEGRYELTYIRDTLGCKVGHCRVQIGNTEESGEELEEDSEDEQAEEGDEFVQKPTKQKPAKQKTGQIPSRYNTKSELEADVQPGENTFDFKLTSNN
jgi:hypothetical protein